MRYRSAHLYAALLWLWASTVEARQVFAQEPRWIESWGTSQPLSNQAPDPQNVREQISAMLARGPQLPSPLVPVPPEIAGQTVRMLVRSSIGGPRIRLTFTNAMDTGPVTFDAVHAAFISCGNLCGTR